jgi:predicted RNA-binding protein associated with RNAse of E/G family
MISQETAERIAAALEAIAEQLRHQYENPKYIQTGIGIVDKDSPEARRARIAGAGLGPLQT